MTGMRKRIKSGSLSKEEKRSGVDQGDVVLLLSTLRALRRADDPYFMIG